MAIRVLGLLGEKLAAWLEQERVLLLAFSGEIRDIKDELKSIEAFLIEADVVVDHGAQMEEWVQQVCNVAYEIEQVLDEYILAYGDQDVRERHGCVSFIKGIFKGIADCFKDLLTKYDIGTRIRELKTRIKSISERRQRYELNGPGVSSLPKLRDPREDALFLDESQIVGTDGPRKILIGFLLEAHTRRGVISVYGMGGLGKTTLAKKVYEDSIVKKKFSLRAWITVSEKFDAKSLLRDLYIQLFGKFERLDEMELLKLKEKLFGRVERLDEMELSKLKKKINEKLEGKRYLVVLDDIWQTDTWKAFKNALLNDNNSCSRIIITTRSEDVAKAACEEVYDHLYPLKALNREDSWKLFSKKVISSSNQPHVPTQELKKRAAKFLEKCNGLPLGLVAIGGLLSTKPLSKWEETYIRFQHYMDESGSLHSEKVDDIRSVISFSYNELPYRLKSCFLYLAIFPEDHSINCSELYRMWSAERFMVRDRQANLSIEELAKSNLDKLIQRSLVQVEVVDAGRRLISCKIHDLIRDFIIWKAGNQNCTTVFYPKEEPSFYPLQYNEDRSSRVRVLFLKYFKSEDFKTINLSCLRYLCVWRLGNVRKDLFSIGKFKHLEILDFRGQYLLHLGDEILQLTQLRNLFTGKDPGTGLPAGMHTLQKLESLSLVSLHHTEYPREKKYGKGMATNELGMLTQLKKLSVCEMTDDDETELFGSIEKMKFLKTFKVSKSIWGDDKFSHAQDSFSFPPSLQCLFMRGKLDQLPPWISSLRNLESLVLYNLHAENNFMESLEELLNLMVLELGGGGYGDKLRFSSTGFPRLRKLDLVDFRFGEMRVEEGAMPDIRSISFASEPSPLIEGLTYLTTLEQIIIQRSKYVPNVVGLRLEKYSWQQGHHPQIIVNNFYGKLWP